MAPWLLVATAAVLSHLGAVAAGHEPHLDAFSSPAYRRLARADSDSVVPFVVALRAADFDALERRLWEVSDPR
ncbi:hypothetical protein PINS_up003762 [Pythium insidiosum]|nr:hypothetical protein PINS_up003762 [Pythium insidiosum]